MTHAFGGKSYMTSQPLGHDEFNPIKARVLKIHLSMSIAHLRILAVEPRTCPDSSIAWPNDPSRFLSIRPYLRSTLTMTDKLCSQATRATCNLSRQHLHCVVTHGILTYLHSQRSSQWHFL